MINKDYSKKISLVAAIAFAFTILLCCTVNVFADENPGKTPDNPQPPAITAGFNTGDDGQTYYYDEDLKKVKGWLSLGDNKYYFDKKSGAMKTGWTKIGEYKYFFNKKNGKMYRGWHKIGEYKYYFHQDYGRMYRGWHKIGEYKYFFHKTNGRMYRGWHKIGKHKYYFHKTSGRMYRGWHKIGNNKYFFNKKNGHMYRGLHKIGKHKYYFSKKNGKMLKGLKKIGKNVYNIDSKGRVKRIIYGNKKAIALTYDDGPAGGTQKIVDTLKKNGGAATFFVVGNRASMYSDALKNAVEIGCQMGSHTYQHKMLGSLDPSGIRWQMRESIKSIKKYSGQKPVICRTPGGELGSTIQANVGMPIILWSIDTLDWKTQSADSTYNAVINGAYDGAIVLMHDLWDSTASASTRIIPELKERGYQMVTIEELALLKGKKLKDGEVYYSFQ